MFVTALALLFLIRLRFPSDESIAATITRRYGRSTLQKYRSTERLDFKLHKAQLDLDFLKTCRTHNLTPKFLEFKAYNKDLPRSRLYRSCQNSFLNHEIKSKGRQVIKLEKERDKSFRELKDCVNFIDFNHFTCLIEKTNHNSLCNVRYTHRKKLQNLGFVDPDGIHSSKIIFNYSSRTLTEVEKSVLSKGLNFALSTRKPNF